MRIRPRASVSSQPNSYSSLLLVPGVLLMCAGLCMMATIVFFFLIGFLFALVGVLLYVAGLWLTSQSGASNRAKAIVALFPIASSLVALGVFVVGSLAEPTTILVPDGYRGYVAVVFNESCAPPLPREAGRRVAALPSDGIVIASDTEEYRSSSALRRDRYVVLDREGRRLGAIPILDVVEYSGTEAELADPDRPAVIDSADPTDLDLIDPAYQRTFVRDLGISFTFQSAYVGTIRTWRGTTDAAYMDLLDRTARRVVACRRAAGQPEDGPPEPSQSDPSSAS